MDYEAKLSDIIASLPEIEGGFLYSPDSGIYANQATGLASDDGLFQVALKFSKIFSLLSVHFHDTGNFRATFKDLVLFGMLVDRDHWMFLFHRPTLSPTMLNMTVQLALHIETDEVEQGGTREKVPAPPEAESHSDATGDAILASLLAPESELSKPLNKIRDELAKYIGPVAELVFEESTAEWASNSPPTLAALPELMSVFEEEIDDDKDRTTFKEALKPFLAEVK